MSRQTNVTRKLVLNSPDRKPSVFERLGTKSGSASEKNVCKNWEKNGTCPLNKQCKLARSHVLISPLKRSKSDTMKKSLIVHKKCKDEHKKSVHSHHNSEVEWEGWELGDLEDADEKVLEKRKQELQRELQLQLKKEKELTRKKEKRTDKKRAASTSSSSSTSTESSSSSSSTSSSSSEPKKRISRKRKHSSSSSESVQSFHRQKKTVKTTKTKLATARKPLEKKDTRVTEGTKSKSGVAAKKSTGAKKSYSPVNWDKSRARSPAKQPSLKKTPQRSPDSSKNKSSSPRYDKSTLKTKPRNYSPKAKSKDPSPKRGPKKTKDSALKEKPRQSSPKTHTSPSRTRKTSPSRSRRHEETSEKRRTHHEDQKHASRKDRSREKDRKREIPRGRSNEYDNNGGLKKGGKILPLKPVAYNKDEGNKKEITTGKSERSVSDGKTKENSEKDRNRTDRDRDKGERDKTKCDRDKIRRKKSADDHERRPARERESEKTSARGRDDRPREREGERTRFAKEREADRQKEREEALERCRERQRERDRLEKERKEKDERKHQREGPETRGNHERDLPSLLDLKPEPTTKISSDTGPHKSIEKASSARENQRNSDRGSLKTANQERDRGSPADRDHDRRDQSMRKQSGGTSADKDQETRRNREGGESRNSSVDLRRSLGEGRQWEDSRRPSSDGLHDRRRTLDSTNGDRRQHPPARRPQEDAYRRHPRGEGDADLRDLGYEERRAGRYDHKWISREEARDEVWPHYTRRGGREAWNGDWPSDQPRQTFVESERGHVPTDAVHPDQNGKRRNGSEGIGSTEGSKDKGPADAEQVPASGPPGEEGDALSDISDDPDDILNRDDYPGEEPPPNLPPQNSNQQIYIRSNEYLFEQRRPLLECLGERSLDFEEISDEELEEETRVTKGIADVLGADWAGLLRETRPKVKRVDGAGSAHRRWRTKKLISITGISLRYAGEAFFRKFMDECLVSDSEGTPAEKQSSSNSDKENEKEETDEKESKKEEKSENEISIEAETGPEIFHPIPGLHAVFRETRAVKSTLFTSHSRFKRALSARTDLALRRELCNLPSKEPLHFTPLLDNKMYEASIQQFRG